MLRMLLLVALLALNAPAQNDAWFETRLANGLRVILVDAPLADEQVTVAIHPWGLLDDGAGQAQLAHLAEHVVVRSVAPDELEPRADGILLKGETMGPTLRLDVYAPADRWQQALDWHRDMLTGASFEEGQADVLLERMVGEIEQEVEMSLRIRFTQRWALAAWNQVVRHGKPHVGVQADLRSVDADDVVAAAAARLTANRDSLLVSIGPVPKDELLAGITERFGELPGRRTRRPAPTVAPGQIRSPGSHTATWDVGMGHLIHWWLVPDTSPADRAAVDALSLIVNTRIQQRGEFGRLGVQAVAAADLITPEGRWFMISASVPDGVDVAMVEAAVDGVVAGLGDLPEASLLIRSMTEQLTEWPDFADLRTRFSGQDGVEWIEAQQALFLIYAQLNMGLSLEAVIAAYAALVPSDLEQLARESLTKEARSRLLLKPGA